MVSKSEAAENKKEYKGEVLAFMKDMEKESRVMMRDLIDIDDMLVELKDRIDSRHTTKEEIIDAIDSIRLKIGVIEKEDRRELNEEEVAESLLSKLKKWVDQVV